MVDLGTMHKTQIFRLNNDSHIAYRKLDMGSKVTVVFLHGFMSSMYGTKASAIYDCCLSNKVNCIVFDYFGHGESSGIFEECTLSDWKRCCCDVITNLADTPLVLVGSSMGAWLALLTAMCFPAQVKGIVCLASAADFTETLDLTDSERAKLSSDGAVELVRNQCSYTISQDLITDGKNHLLLTKDKIELNCPVAIIHALDDDLVHYKTSISIAEKIESRDVYLHLIRPGGHNLDEQEALSFVLDTVLAMVRKVESSL